MSIYTSCLRTTPNISTIVSLSFFVCIINGFDSIRMYSGMCANRYIFVHKHIFITHICIYKYIDTIFLHFSQLSLLLKGIATDNTPIILFFYLIKKVGWKGWGNILQKNWVSIHKVYFIYIAESLFI